MSAVDVGHMLVVLGGAFGRELTDVQARVYMTALASADPGALAAVTERAVRECRFFPTVSELVALLDGFDAADGPVLVWMELRQAAGSVGQYRGIEFDDVAAAVAFEEVFGDWPSFCALDEGPALAQRRQEFMAAYRRARARITSGAAFGARLEYAGQIEVGPTPVRVGAAGRVDRRYRITEGNS
jgi:hypothetical protein